MKKNQKNIAVNNQENKDIEVYTLYPENAIEGTNHKRQQQKRDDGFETELKAKEHHNVISINQRSFNSK